MNSSFVIALSVIGDLIFELEVVKLMWKQLLSLALRFSEVSYRSLSDAVVVTARCTLSLDLAKGNFVFFFFFKGIEYSWVGSL